MTASISVCDPQRPRGAWAFLVVQGLVDDSGDGRDAFLDVFREQSAQDHTGPSLALRVASALQRAGLVHLDVRDEGYGIATEHLATVFERFRRPGADPSTRGMGLGLYLSRNLMEAIGGSLSVRSPGRGKGATFTITLPVAPEWNGSPEPDHVSGTGEKGMGADA